MLMIKTHKLNEICNAYVSVTACVVDAQKSNFTPSNSGFAAPNFVFLEEIFLTR